MLNNKDDDDDDDKFVLIFGIRLLNVCVRVCVLNASESIKTSREMHACMFVCYDVISFELN